MAILDKDGKPMKPLALAKDVAGPTLAGIRQAISGHPAEGLTPRRLAALHREAALGEPERYLQLAEDIEERDLHYLGVLGTRRRQVAQLPITVSPASDAAEHKKHADFVTSWINDGVLGAALFDLLDAIGKGFSVLEIDWQVQLGRMLPRELVWRPQRWFTFDPVDGETVLLREATGNQVLPPHKFVIHRHRAKSGLTIRSGLARVASWAWMYKSFTLKDWAIFTQNFGMPIRIGKYGRNATEDEKDVLWTAVSNIAGDCAAIIPSDMVIEFEEVAAKGDTSKFFLERADWMDRQVSKAVLGQTTTTDAVSGGHAVAKEHRLVQEDIERADAGMATATVNAQIIPNLVAFEFGPQDAYPKIRIGRPDEVPLGEFAEAFAKLAPLGLTAEMSYMRGRLQIPEPKADAELVGGKAAPSIMSSLFGDEGADPKGAVPPKKRTPVERLLQSRHARGREDEIADALMARIEEEAAGAMAGLTDDVRRVLVEAKDLTEAREKLSRMSLDPAAFADAMARGLAIAHLAGRAALVDDLVGRT